MLKDGLDHRTKSRKWIINICGYATIIPSKGDLVYGFIYELTPEDEKILDGYEGVPDNYIKEIFPIQGSSGGDGNPTEGITMNALVYVDVQRTTESKPKTEYIYRMNMAIADGIGKGIPRDYFEKYLRPFIPETVKN